MEMVDNHVCPRDFTTFAKRRCIFFFILCYFVINAIENDVIAKLVKDLYLFVHLFDILCAYLYNLFLILIHD